MSTLCLSNQAKQRIEEQNNTLSKLAVPDFPSHFTYTTITLFIFCILFFLDALFCLTNRCVIWVQYVWVSAHVAAFYMASSMFPKPALLIWTLTITVPNLVWICLLPECRAGGLRGLSPVTIRDNITFRQPLQVRLVWWGINTVQNKFKAFKVLWQWESALDFYYSVKSLF